MIKTLDWDLRMRVIHDMIACYSEVYFSMQFSWWFDNTLISQFTTFSATIMIISYDNDILIFDMYNVIKMISRYYHSIISKISIKYQNINNQSNDILSRYFDKPQSCTLVRKIQCKDELTCPAHLLTFATCINENLRCFWTLPTEFFKTLPKVASYHAIIKIW